jgi:hypothetical protein
MKCFNFFLLFIVSINFSSLSVSHAEQLLPITIKSISYTLEPDGRESIILKFSGPITGPNIFRLNGSKPRLVFDFPQAVYTGGKAISVGNSVLAYGIRIGVHTTPVVKIRVVLDLSSEDGVKYEQVISDDGTVLTITLSPIYIYMEKTEKKAEVVQIAVEQGIGIEKTEIENPVPPAEKNVPPVVVSKKTEAEEVTQSNGSAGSDGGALLLEISFDNSSNKGEMVVFHLNDFYPPTVSAIEEETPRVLCDFMDMQLGVDVNEEIVAKGKYIERIRTVRHENPGKVRVILDLAPDRDYDLQQVFFKNDNLFVLIVNELPTEASTD